ncbi:MAG: porphobilinogen synthase [Candidatus Bathyarchaeota archaeon]|nr:porphobilinogen synthase [Candidatus Bathyarchaeota archaeon]MDH5788531.1 porphobilinogen synthase [Candidatus Bathyarchaeota archaeon]
MRLTTRIKRSKQMIRMVRPVELTTSDLIYPIFVREDGKKFEIASMKGQDYFSLEDAVTTCKKTIELGIPAVMVFGVLKEKDADGSTALQKNGFHPRVFRKLKKELGDKLVLISNLCLCDYTADEFCVYTKKGKVLNEKTAEMLGKIAVVHAEAGADVVAPAAMCDGQVRHIRSALDREGFEDVPVMTYVKTDSCLFQPFFEAMTLSKTPRSGVDSSTFRTDIINEKMFMQKVDLDVSEGADIVIVKPALTNLDLILRVRQEHPTIPIAAYQVSGEYAMIKLLGENGHLDEDVLLLESLKSIKRAGADMILTYSALEAAKLLKGKA